MFPLSNVLEFRKENAETSGRYAVMSDAAKDAIYLRLATKEAYDDMIIATEEMIRVQRSMDRAQARYTRLHGQLQVAELLLKAADRG